MNYNPKEFGMRTTKLRRSMGKTQQEIADLLHTSLDNYRGIEKGRRNPSLELLVAMSLIFEVSVRESSGNLKKPWPCSPG